MAKFFAITTTTENLIADVNGTAKASIIFTVTNNTDKPIRGVAHLQPLERTEESWLSLDGEPEKDFPACGTQQFTVIFNKPLQPVAEGQTEPEEKYPYRIYVASAVRPDEDFDEGPLVTIFKPERKGTKKKGGVPWWVFLIIGIVVLALLVVGLIFGLRSCGGKAKKPVPDVTSKPTSVPDAKKLIEDAGFTVDVKPVLAADKKAGNVVNQDPAANAEAEEGSQVNLTKPEEATVPVIQNACIVAAMTSISGAGLKVNDNITGNLADIQSCASKVQSTAPIGKTVVAKGSSVTLNFNCVPKPNQLCRQINPKEFLKDTTKIGINERKVIESSFSR
jgi:hypothetical protein